MLFLCSVVHNFYFVAVIAANLTLVRVRVCFTVVAPSRASNALNTLISFLFVAVIDARLTLVRVRVCFTVVARPRASNALSAL
jgi:hypothetical protein